MSAEATAGPVGRAPRDDVTTVVMTRNRREDVLATLPRHQPPVVLVDNASTDGTVEAVRARLPHVEVVALPRNVGAQARTEGVRRARTPYVAFADDDSWWAPGALDRATAALDASPRLGLVAARILVGPQETLDPVCVEMARSPLVTAPEAPGPALLGFVACAAVVRREAFLEVGGFDPVVRFPGEEERVALDLADAGWGLAYLDGVVVHHHPSPRREGDDARQAGITRSRLLTAVMRLPWDDVAAEARRAGVLPWPRDRAARSALTAALPRLPAALRARRVVGADVLGRRAALSPVPEAVA